MQHQINLKEEVIKELRRKIEVDEIQLKITWSPGSTASILFSNPG